MNQFKRSTFSLITIPKKSIEKRWDIILKNDQQIHKKMLNFTSY